MRLNRPRMFALFFAIALGGGCLIALLFPAAWAEASGVQKAIRIVHLMPVLLATLFVQGPILKQPVLKPLGLSFKPNRWWLIAWVSPLVVLFVGLAASAALGYELVLDGASYVAHKRASMPPELLQAFDESVATSPPGSPLYFLGPGLLAGVTLNLLLALATEVGWRGFLFREIQGGFWRRSILIGLAESVYFAPLVALGYRYGDPSEGLLLSGLWCLAISPPLVYIRVRSDSVLPAAAFRGTILALAAVAADLSVAPASVGPFFGATGALGLVVLLGLFWLHDRSAEQGLMSGSGTDNRL